MTEGVTPDYENTSIELSSDLSELWHDMEFEGNSLWNLNKVKEKRRIFQFTFENDTEVIMGKMRLRIRSEDKLVFFPKGKDLKADHLSTFYLSLSKEDRQKFYKNFGKQITEFFTKQLKKN